MEGMAPQSGTLKPHAPLPIRSTSGTESGVALAEDAHVHRHGVDGFGASWGCSRDGRMVVPLVLSVKLTLPLKKVVTPLTELHSPRWGEMARSRCRRR